MPELSKGANSPLPDGPVTITVSSSSPLDVAALLLTDAGKVRSDADFVFYNQPTGPGVTHRAGPPDAVLVDPAALPVEIETVAVSASLDGSGPATFGAVGRIEISLAGSSGEPVTFVPDGLSSETAVVLVEVYRRAGVWKVRAVGQGYDDGLGGIATDFGVNVDGPAEPAAPTPVAPPPSSGPVNLDKGRVSLTKNQTVSLVKTGAPPLSRVAMGLGWDPARKGKNVDLDASVIAYDTAGKDLESVYFGHLVALRGAIRHLGDNLTGQGDGDDETILIELGDLPPSVQTLLFTVNSFAGQKFTDVANAYCRLLDGVSGEELVRFDLSDSRKSTGVFMCKMVRSGSSWQMTALGEFEDGRSVRSMVKPGRRFLGSA